MLRTTLSLLLLSALWLPSCGGGNGSDGPTSEVSITLTDAPSEEVDTFEVDVTDIVFHRVAATDISVLARRTRVDFAALEDLADLIVGRGLTPGLYTGLTMTLDFSNASVYLKGLTAPATVVDQNGAAITGTVEVRVDFATTHRPRLVINRHHLYVLDLDLDSALTPDVPNNRVTFLPVLSAVVDPSNPKPIGATGVLTAVDTGNSQFTLARLATDDSVIGTIRVRTDANTIFQVDGVVQTGSAGLAALATLGLGTTRVFVQGTVNRATRELQATAVEAGTGVFGNGQDWVEGLITGRNNSAVQDCSLTVMGRSRRAATGFRQFNTTHTVQVKYGVTKVLRRGASATLSTDHLDIGQRVLIFGSLAGTTLDATAATAVARELSTSVFGIASGPVVASTLTLNVARIGLRPISDFQFTVGGIVEAVPTAYTVDTTGLSPVGITAGSHIRAIGFVNPVGIVGDANFRAVALVNRSEARQLELCVWSPASLNVFSATSASALALNVSAALVRRVDDGFGSTTLNPSPTPTIEPRTVTGSYRILSGRRVEVHTDFGTFVQALEARIGGGAPVHSIVAFGDFSAPTQIMSADAVTVELR